MVEERQDDEDTPSEGESVDYLIDEKDRDNSSLTTFKVSIVDSVRDGMGGQTSPVSPPIFLPPALHPGSVAYVPISPSGNPKKTAQGAIFDQQNSSSGDSDAAQYIASSPYLSDKHHYICREQHRWSPVAGLPVPLAVPCSDRNASVLFWPWTACLPCSSKQKTSATCSLPWLRRCHCPHQLHTVLYHPVHWLVPLTRALAIRVAVGRGSPRTVDGAVPNARRPGLLQSSDGQTWLEPACNHALDPQRSPVSASKEEGVRD